MVVDSALQNARFCLGLFEIVTCPLSQDQIWKTAAYHCNLSDGRPQMRFLRRRAELKGRLRTQGEAGNAVNALSS